MSIPIVGFIGSLAIAFVMGCLFSHSSSRDIIAHLRGMARKGHCPICNPKFNPFIGACDE